MNIEGKKTRKGTAICAILAIFAIALVACDKQPSVQQPEHSEIYYIEGSKVPEDMSLDTLGMSFLDYNPQCMNSVAGHDERDTIYGRFNGRNIDTLHVETRKVKSGDTTKAVEYYAVSSRKTIPEVKLKGTPHRAPKLVYEGDLDGNGTDEWGYLATGVSSQWRTYSVFTLQKGRWCYLVKSNRLETTDWFRCSGKEVVEKGGKKGYVKINYGFATSENSKILDTVVKVSFTPITK